LTVRVGVVGCGRWGANVLRDLVAIGTDVTAADREPRRRDHARAAGARHVVALAHELPECDGYVVVTPASTHRNVCEELLARGTSVFVEKPPCGRLADVEALAQIGDDRLFVMHKWRYHAGVRALADVARSGRLGTVLRLETIRAGPEHLPPDVDVLWHLGPHDLSIAVEILGGVAPVHDASGSRDADGRLTRCDATMRPAAGPEHRMTLALGVPNRVRCVTVVGTEGSAVLERPDSSVVALSTVGGPQAIPIPTTMPLAEELRVFVEYLGGGPPPVSSMATAVDIARCLAEIAQSIDGTRR
jgi:predicted dehydrogenase